MTQSTLILDYLKQGNTLTVLQALQLFGCYALSQRVSELKRQGLPIKSTLIEVPSGKHVAQYEYDYDDELKHIAYG